MPARYWRPYALFRSLSRVELLLVRHALTHSNVAGALDTGHPGADLTALGEEQAAALVTRLTDRPIDALWCSPRLRTRRTAAPLAAAHGLVPEQRDGLVEIAAGAVEMSSDPNDGEGYRAAIAAWITGDPGTRMPGGETGTEVLARMDAVVAEVLAARVERACLVAHGAVIRFWCARRVPNIGADRGRAPLGNTGVVRLAGDEEAGWTATEWDSEVLTPG